MRISDWSSDVCSSDLPTWANHRALFEGAGFKVYNYPYYDAATHGLNFDAMLASFQPMPPHTIVILHACCHNPTGVDPSIEQWKQIAQVAKERQLVPFLHIAYQGLGAGIEQEAGVVRMFADLDHTLMARS